MHILMAIFVCVLLVVGSQASAGNSDFTVDIDVLVVSGDSSPDGNGVFSNEFSLPPVLNNNSQVLFWARLLATIDPGPIDDAGFFRADRQSLINIARGGDTAATGNPLGLALTDITDGPRFLRMYGIAGSGVVTYAAPDQNGEFAIYQADGQQTDVLVQNGENTAFGDDLDLSPGLLALQFNDQGQSTFLTFADTVLGNDTPLYVRTSQSGESVVFEPFQSLPDGRQIQLGGFLSLVQAAVGLNNNGEVGATLTTGVSMLDVGIYTGDSLVKVLHTGEPAPDGLGTFSNTVGFTVTPLVEMNDQNQALALQAVDDINTDYRGLFFYDGVQLNEWGRTGEMSFGGPLVDFGINFDLNNNGTGLYRVISGDPVAVDRIVIRQAGGGETLIMSDFGQLPPPIELEARGPFSFLLNDNDQAMISGFVIADAASRAALFLYDPDDGLALVIREGMPFRGDTLTGFNVAMPVFPATNRYRNNASNPFNDLGEMVFSYTLSNGESGIALASVEFVDEDLLLRDGFENIQ